MSQATTWEEGCEDAIDAIYGRIQHSGVDYRYSPTEAIKVLRSELSIFDLGTVISDVDFAAMGAVATYCSTKINCDASTALCLQRIQKLLAAKQHDYGHGNIERFGLLGIVVRISDKLARLENLYERLEYRGEESDDALCESMADTWDDIVGYCVIALMVLDDTFKLELEADQTPEPDQQTGLPGGSMYCIDDLGNVYHRREDGSWAYKGQGTLSVQSRPGPAWTQGLEGPQGRPEWLVRMPRNEIPVTFTTTGRKS